MGVFASFWQNGAVDMLYFLGLLIIASGTILLLGLASRQPPSPEGPHAEHDEET